MSEFRKYKPRELMQGLLEGKIYRWDRYHFTSKPDFFKMKGEFIYVADLENEKKCVKFEKVIDSFLVLSVLSSYPVMEVDEKHAKKEIAKRNKELKSEKGC